ncbi:MAG: ABC transporter permease [Flavobacteriales bacterium]|nr:ABC transporter permease [Flavobacteriales bacterium]
MDFSYFIGKKLALRSGSSFTRFIMRLAVVGTALSLAVMLLSVGIIRGFKEEISSKVYGFDGHIQIRNLDLNQSNELQLIDAKAEYLPALMSDPAIESVVPFCSKPGIISSGEEIEGLVFKGVPPQYDWSFFRAHLRRGSIPVYSDSSDSYDILLSERIANMLQCDTGSRFEVYFLHEGKVRRRRMEVKGIFNTGLAEFDRSVCMADLRSIQRIYTVDYSKISGFEIRLKDPEQMLTESQRLDGLISLRHRAIAVQNLYPAVFQWLNIVDSNAVIIIVLMLLVAMVNMITAFLILIIERTNMIGVLKALGASNGQVIRIFLIKGAAMILPGILIGNTVGLLLTWLQVRYGLIKLSEEIYYMSVVPVHVVPTDVLWLSLGTLVLCTLVLLLPALLVRRVSPVVAIRFR